MEKQTIGGFLATLRKANGYTQQEVAEKLGVSNKTLSSWETDKTCPDLTLIPVLADLYGVSADEILRAERRKTGGAASEEERNRDEARAAKSVRALLGRQEKKNRKYQLCFARRRRRRLGAVAGGDIVFYVRKHRCGGHFFRAVRLRSRDAFRTASRVYRKCARICGRGG